MTRCIFHQLSPKLLSKDRFSHFKCKIFPRKRKTPAKKAGCPEKALERVNRTFREDILDAYLFDSLSEVREIAEEWLEEYNAVRPHEALQGLPPYQYALLNA